MANKKDWTIEELAQQCEEAKKNFETLNAQLKQAQQEEEDRKRAKLALEKENRKKEVDEAYEQYQKLLKAYVEDYKVYSNVSDDWFPNKFWRSFF